MPSAVPLTPRADAEQDDRLQALWDDRSSVVPHPILYGTGTNELPGAGLVSVDLAEETSIGPRRRAYASPLAALSGGILVASPRSEFHASTTAAGARFAARFEALRGRLRLPIQKYARLLGTSRRTLYHWLETDRPQPLALDRIERLAEWVAELERHLTLAEIQLMLDPDTADSLGALLLGKGLDAAAERVRVVTEAHRPRRAHRLDVLADDPAGEPPTATAEELRMAFAAFAQPRPSVLRSAESEPPELTY